MSGISQLPGVERVGSGKVRELYAVGDELLLLVATDRISAFDVVLPTEIPGKGKVLTGLTAFWLDTLRGIVADHRVSTDPTDFPAGLDGHAAELAGRAMLCRRAAPLPVECVVRGYLSGSGWAEYQRTGAVCGVALRAGLVESERLPEAIFTPTTKAPVGEHDEAIDFATAAATIGEDLATRCRDASLSLYAAAAAHARERGIVLADTKFEFGVSGDELLLIDEVLTPDSSRFWPLDEYQAGRAQASFDKQYVRDWLAASGWDKSPPAPGLPDDVVGRTRERYVAAYEQLTGRPFADWSP